MSRSVVPAAVPVGTMASFTESCMTKDYILFVNRRTKNFSWNGETAHLQVGKEFVINKIWNAKFSTCCICKSHPDGSNFTMRGCITSTGTGKLDSHDDGGSDLVRISEKEVFHCLHITGRSLENEAMLTQKKKVQFETDGTSLSRWYFTTFLPWPGSGAHISTRSCLTVSASLSRLCATEVFKMTLGRPAFPPAPKYLMTEFVWYTFCATKRASAPYAI